MAMARALGCVVGAFGVAAVAMSLRRALTGEQERCLGALMIVLAAVIAALSILFGACHGGYEQRAPDSAREQEVVVNAAIRAWEARFGSTIECHREHLTLGWASADDRAFDALCVGEQGWDGCTIVRQDGSSTIVLRDALFEQSYLDWLRAHEVTHFLEHCSGRVASGDPDHADDAVWDEQVDETLEALP